MRSCCPSRGSWPLSSFHLFPLHTEYNAHETTSVQLIYTTYSLPLHCYNAVFSTITRLRLMQCISLYTFYPTTPASLTNPLSSSQSTLIISILPLPTTTHPQFLPSLPPPSPLTTEKHAPQPPSHHSSSTPPTPAHTSHSNAPHP